MRRACRIHGRDAGNRTLSSRTRSARTAGILHPGNSINYNDSAVIWQLQLKQRRLDAIGIFFTGFEPVAFPMTIGTLSLYLVERKKRTLGRVPFWWTIPDLNRSPLPCHGSALPNELMAQNMTVFDYLFNNFSTFISFQPNFHSPGTFQAAVFLLKNYLPGPKRTRKFIPTRIMFQQSLFRICSRTNIILIFFFAFEYIYPAHTTGLLPDDHRDATKCANGPKLNNNPLSLIFHLHNYCLHSLPYLIIFFNSSYCAIFTCLPSGKVKIVSLLEDLIF